MNTVPQIFLSYARQDEERVKRLYEQLVAEGFKPWMDTKDILGGESWKPAIQKAARNSDFFVVCLSTNSVKRRGMIQEEIKEALDSWKGKLLDDIYLIPIRLEECESPESLADFQRVDLFEKDGLQRLVRAIQVGMERRQK
jgi:hypothetical protein